MEGVIIIITVIIVIKIIMPARSLVQSRLIFRQLVVGV